MGIQINGQTDTISAGDGGLVVNGAELPTVTNINASGIGTFGSGVVLTGGDITLGTGVTASGATANTFTLSTNGSERLRVDSSGRFGVGTTSVSFGKLAISKGGAEGIEIEPGDSSNVNVIQHYNRSGTAWVSCLNNAAAHIFTINGGGNEKARIDSSGRLLVGTSSSSNTLAFAPVLQVEGNSAASSSVSALRTSDDSNPVYIGLAKKRGSSGSVLNGDLVGRLIFMGFDGSSYLETAHIETQIDGTPGANDMPGRLVFSTNSGSPATSPTERMRIHSQGTISTARGLTIGNISGNTASPTRFFIDGSALATGVGTHTLKWNSSTGQVTQDSSSRLVKEQIVDCPYGIDAVKLLQPRKYFRIDSQVDEIGFIADEIAGVMPEFVPVGAKSVITGNSEDTEEIPLGVHYEKVTAVLTKAFQEAIAKIETLEAEVAALKAQ